MADHDQAASAPCEPTPGPEGAAGPRSAGSHQCAEEPASPGTTGPPPFAPGGLGAIREPDPHRPRPQAAQRPGTRTDARTARSRASGVARRRTAAAGFPGASRRGEVHGHARHHRGRPRVLHKRPWGFDGPVGMMRQEPPRHLRKRVMGGNHHLTDRAMLVLVAFLKRFSARLWGRAPVRARLYISTLIVVRYNPVLKHSMTAYAPPARWRRWP